MLVYRKKSVSQLKSCYHQVLLPLHSCPKLANFHAQLVYCVIQFIEKDPVLMESFVRGFLKRRPKTAATKEVLFLGELEEIIDVMQPQEFAKLQTLIFTKIGKCIKSEHYQVKSHHPSDCAVTVLWLWCDYECDWDCAVTVLWVAVTVLWGCCDCVVTMLKNL